MKSSILIEESCCKREEGHKSKANVCAGAAATHLQALFLEHHLQKNCKCASEPVSHLLPDEFDSRRYDVHATTHTAFPFRGVQGLGVGQDIGEESSGVVSDAVDQRGDLERQRLGLHFGGHTGVALAASLLVLAVQTYVTKVHDVHADGLSIHAQAVLQRHHLLHGIARDELGDCADLGASVMVTECCTG